MIQYKALDIHSKKPVAGWYVHADSMDGETHIIIEDLTRYDGCCEFWHMDVHEVDPNTLEAVNDSLVFCKDCAHGRVKFFQKMGETVECQKYNYDNPRQYKNLFDYCSQGIRRDTDVE